MSPRAEIKALLLGGGPLTGHVWPSGGGEVVPFSLIWSPENGAQLDLISSPEDWDGELGGPTFTLHAETSGGEPITFLDSMVTQTALVTLITRIHSTTIAIGSLISPQTRWPRAIYSTVNLSEWRAQTGLEYSRPDKRRRGDHLRVNWGRPAPQEIALPRASLSFVSSADTSIGYAADWAIKTWLALAVEPKRKFTFNGAYRDYAVPLLAFTHFVSDRPDSISLELLVNPETGTEVEVLRQAKHVAAREWILGPRDGYLFHSDDVPDLERAMRRWWMLYRQAWPALGLFGEHIAEGRSYSPSLLLMLFTALERYAEARYGRREFKRLRTYAALPSEVTGCTNDALKLLGASRSYFAHPREARGKYSIDDIEGSLLESIRRASALMQACLLRELHFGKPMRERLMRDHYANWPLP